MQPSSNWLALKKNLKGSARPENGRPSKRRKVETSSEGSRDVAVAAAPSTNEAPSEPQFLPTNRDSVEFLRKMVHGQVEHPPAHLLPGKYLAIDCEMVGIAGDPKKPALPGKRDQGDESSLARVSVVNYHGAVLLDVFVKQRERVTDWRTAFSGVRESDMVNAKSFLEVQKLVADLLKDRILVGHAVHNDLKVLLLSHPHNMTRDTQALAGRHGTLISSKAQVAVASSKTPAKAKTSRRPALRKLVSQELGIEIQKGEHSSVTDARATMAIYRLHRKTWDRGFKPHPSTPEKKQSKTQSDTVTTEEFLSSGSTFQETSTRRKRSWSAGPDDDADPRTSSEGVHKRRTKKKTFAVNRKGVSSGLSVVVKKREGRTEAKHVVSGVGGGFQKDNKWWGTLG